MMPFLAPDCAWVRKRREHVILTRHDAQKKPARSAGPSVCMANRGTTKEFVCPYHQWTYDLSGQLLGVPFRRGFRGQGGMPMDFRPDEHGLQRLAVARRNGVVFASLATPDESLESYLGDRTLGYFDRVFDGRKLEILGYMRQRIPSNWKLMFENIKDP